MPEAGWVDAPDGEVLLAGACLARDGDGQGCTHGFVHLGPHQHTGLRAWLESRRADALIRAYPPPFAERHEAMETPLFERFGFLSIVHQDLVRTEDGGISWGWAMVVGPLLAPTAKVEVHLRLVCFAHLMEPSG